MRVSMQQILLIFVMNSFGKIWSRQYKFSPPWPGDQRIKYAIGGSRETLFLRPGNWEGGLSTPHREELTSYEMIYLRFSRRSLWRVVSSGICRRAVCQKLTDISEEDTVSIFAQAELRSRWFLAWFILRLRRWRRHVPPKHRLTFNGLHGVISQKIELFIITAMKTSNPTYLYIIRMIILRRMRWTGHVFRM
jgi:hypothetical protein